LKRPPMRLTRSWNHNVRADSGWCAARATQAGSLLFGAGIASF
jgi:hypothetical protein